MYAHPKWLKRGFEVVESGRIRRFEQPVQRTGGLKALLEPSIHRAAHTEHALSRAVLHEPIVRNHGVEEPLAAGRHFNRTVEQVALRNFRERPEGCLRVESGKILRQEVIVQQVHADARKPTEHGPNCRSCRPRFGGCIGVILLHFLAKGAKTKKGGTWGFVAQIAVGGALRAISA